MKNTLMFTKRTLIYVVLANYAIAKDLMWEKSLTEIPGKGA